MASLHRDRKSPYWYLRAKDVDGNWKSKATPFRHDVPGETRKARQLEAETTAKERASGPHSPLWKAWVPDWIAAHYLNPLTRKVSNERWSMLAAFFEERNIRHPAALKREDCYAYLAWRTKGGKWKDSGKRRKPGHHNTARHELVFLARILGEAELRGYIVKNPARKLGIKRLAPKSKQPLTDEEIVRLQEALAEEDALDVALGFKPWMSRCFKIALLHGVRFTETQVPMSDVHLDRGIIEFNKTKGGKPFAALIHPALKDDLKAWKEAGDAFTCELPRGGNRRFGRLFERLGIKKSFHCTRVTVATRLALGGVDERLAKLYLNHSSSLVHSIYVKLRPEHAAGVAAALQFPGHDHGASVPSTGTSP